MKKVKGLLATLCVFAIIFSMGIVAAADTSFEEKDAANLVTTVAELSTQKSELIVCGKNSLDAYTLNNSVKTNRAVNSITSSISQISGNLTSANQIDFYFIDIPAERSLVYGVASNNPDIYVHFCVYEEETGTVYPTDYYVDVNNAGALNNLPADRYVLMITYKAGYTTDAGYTLLTNYSIKYSTGMSFVDFTGDLSYVMTRSNRETYVNDRKICTFAGRTHLNSYQKVYYVSPYDMWRVSFSSILYGEYNTDYGTIYGINITGTSGIGYYKSEKYEFQNAVILYLGADNLVEVREHESHNVYRSTKFLMDSANAGSFIVYDCDTNQYVQLYLASNEVPQAHRLDYGFID